MTKINKLLFEFDNLKLATKEERAIFELLKTVIIQEEKIQDLQKQILKLKVRW